MGTRSPSEARPETKQYSGPTGFLWQRLDNQTGSVPPPCRVAALRNPGIDNTPFRVVGQFFFRFFFFYFWTD